MCEVSKSNHEIKKTEEIKLVFFIEGFRNRILNFTLYTQFNAHYIFKKK